MRLKFTSKRTLNSVKLIKRTLCSATEHQPGDDFTKYFSLRKRSRFQVRLFNMLGFCIKVLLIYFYLVQFSVRCLMQCFCGIVGMTHAQIRADTHTYTHTNTNPRTQTHTAHQHVWSILCFSVLYIYVLSVI